MIYTVTTNPNIDYYMDLRAPLRVGGINRSGRELLAPGGKGINVSLMLQTLGKPSCVLGYLAGPTGRLLEALMKDLREFSAKLNNPDSTIGKLVTDDQLYGEVQTLMKKASQTLDGMGDAAPISAIGAAAGALF